MKNKDITSAILGSTFFAIPYVGLSVAFAPSLVIGGCAFLASELMFSGIKTKEKLRNTNKSLYQKIIEAKKEQKQIKTLIPKVENIETQKNLKEINETINKILEEVEKNPRKEKRLMSFFWWINFFRICVRNGRSHRALIQIVPQHVGGCGLHVFLHELVVAGVALLG